MTTGLLIITHETIGNALVDTASSMLGMCPMALELLPVTPGCAPEDVMEKARAAIDDGLAIAKLEGLIALTNA